MPPVRSPSAQRAHVRKTWRRVLVALWLLGVSASASPAAAEKRLALVIGNDTYRNVPSLQKARADAESVSSSLQTLGFEVTKALDADFASFNTAISTLSERIEPGDTALFYFAGHGFAIDGRNYLLPTDVPAARAGQADLVRRAAIATDEVTGSLRAKGAKTVVAILDACRDNPFATSGTRSLAGGRGLARPTTENGEFVLMSAGTAQTALDRLDETDTERNSVFTRVFLKALTEPGVDLVGIARATRTKVAELAASRSHSQTPSYYDDGAGAFIFVPAGSRVTVDVPSAPALEAAPRVVPSTAAFDLGSRWTVAEYANGIRFDGIWTRGGADSLNAWWRDTSNGRTAQDTIRLVSVRGSEITLHRVGLNGDYYGQLSPDGRTIKGRATWYKPGEYWTATIH